MWVKFLKSDRRRVRPVEGGVVTSVIDYRPGMVENVPREYGERLVREGKAEATVSPRKPNDVTPTA
jgi:hypothetical protein